MVLVAMLLRPNSKVLFWAIACIGMSVFPATVIGAKWSVVPSLELRGEYNDNIRLTTGESDAVWGANITPAINLENRTPSSMTNIGAQFRFVNYSGDEVRDRNIQYLTLLTRKQTLRNGWELKGSLRRDSILTAFVTDSSVDIPDADQGQPVDVKRSRVYLRPTWTHDFNERNSLALDLGYWDISHSGSKGGANIVDSDTKSVGVALNRRVSERGIVSLTGRYSEFRADSDNESDDITLGMRIDYDFTETLSAFVSAGLRNTETRTGLEENDSTGTVYEGRISKQASESTNFAISLARRLLPSSTGRLLESDRFDIRVVTKIQPRLNFLLTARAFQNGSLVDDSSGNDRKYYSIEPKLRWSLTRKWKLDGFYRYRYQKYDSNKKSADSNAVFVAVRYSWPLVQASR